mmetsp:Transcript_4924/g.13588  ORF Transcript_4924/g.13588 Transcript_4924/m.13588 type:complete len:84 (-) Transcript_4924:778-1029(-)
MSARHGGVPNKRGGLFNNADLVVAGDMSEVRGEDGTEEGRSARRVVASGEPLGAPGCAAVVAALFPAVVPSPLLQALPPLSMT